MRCKKCGGDDWYVKGKYRRCIPCHNEIQLAAYHNRKQGGSTAGKRSTLKARPLSQTLAVLRQTQQQTSCSRGHEFTDENTRLEVDGKGMTHRRCKQCERIKYRRRYGLDTPSRISELMQEKDNPWDQIQ
jgi:hypothetical protein